jgi:hypothetical protein
VRNLESVFTEPAEIPPPRAGKGPVRHRLGALPGRPRGPRGPAARAGHRHPRGALPGARRPGQGRRCRPRDGHRAGPRRAARQRRAAPRLGIVRCYTQ